MLCFRRRVVTDEEHVQRVRRVVAFMDRWRRPVVAVCAVLLLGRVVWLALIVQVLNQMVLWNNGPGFVVGFALGVTMGALIGLRGAVLTIVLAAGFKSNLRTQRLMLQYHDAIESLAPKPLQQVSPSAPGLNCGAEDDFLDRYP